MCRPVYHNVKRTELAYYATMPEGRKFKIILMIPITLDATMIHKIEVEGGVLLFVQISGDTWYSHYWNGVRVLWYPTYGGGGWVDTAKDAQAHTMCALVSRTIESTERLMSGCMSAQA